MWNLGLMLGPEVGSLVATDSHRGGKQDKCFNPECVLGPPLSHQVGKYECLLGLQVGK